MPCATTDRQHRVAPDASEVVFTVHARPDITSIHLVGDFNEWSYAATPMRRRGTRFTATLKLAPGRYRYQYLVDGERWENDWAADDYEETPAGAYVSVLEVTEDEGSAVTAAPVVG
jgi:1,4-alpha-glucan branching enzyme